MGAGEAAMRVLVTGGGGFLGSWICRQLRARGDDVVAFQRSVAPALEQAGIHVVRGDLADVSLLAAAMTGCDAVVHCAAMAGAWGDPARFHAVNVVGTRHVIQSCRVAGVKRLVYTSSPSVVHAGGDIEGGDESLPYPAYFKAQYPATKAAAEQMVLAANNGHLATVALRPHLVWGPGDNHLLPRLIQRAEKGVLRLPGAGKLIDTVYVENAAQAHVLAIDALQANPACRDKAYFISNGEPWPQGRIITELLQHSGHTVDIRSMSPLVAKAAGGLCEWIWTLTGRKDEPPVTRWSAEQLSTAHWYDISAAQRDLGYVPQVSIEQGLARL
jgi:nucleoside-diphosphate-sugar epimerase